ncbi:hypothetical protein P7C70_g4165, partial [Phenoliferia sp. Uapishka_3]
MQSIDKTPPSSDASGVALDPAFVTPRSGANTMPQASIQADIGDQTVGPVATSDVPLPAPAFTDSIGSRAPSPNGSSDFHTVNRISAERKQKAREIRTSELQFVGHQSDEEAPLARAYSPAMQFGSFSPLIESDNDSDSGSYHVARYPETRPDYTHPDRAKLIEGIAQMTVNPAEVHKVTFETATNSLKPIKSPSNAEKKAAKKVLKAAAAAKLLRRRSKIFGGVGANKPQATPMRGVGVKTKGLKSNDSSSSSSSSSSSEDSTSASDSSSSSSSSSSESDDPKPKPKAKHSLVADLPVPGHTSGIGKGLTKIAEPKRYSGNNDTPRALRMWERDVRSYLLMGNVHPDSYLAVAYIGSCLAGEAKRWYGDHVVDKVQRSFPINDAHCTRSPFSLKKIVSNLTSRFVSKTSYRDAAFIWNRIAQIDKGRTKTVNALALTIEDVAMDRYETSELDMKITLVDALIPEIAEKLFEKYPNIESPKLKWKTLIKSAIRYERGYNQRQSVKRAKATGKSYSTYEMNTNGKKFHREMHDSDPMRRGAEPVYRSYPDNSGRYPDQKGRYGNGGRHPQMPNHVRTQPSSRDHNERSNHQPSSHATGPSQSPARFPNNIAVPRQGTGATGPQKVYTDAEKAQYKERRDKDKCYVCGSSQHKADFHKTHQNSAIGPDCDSSEEDYKDFVEQDFEELDGFDLEEEDRTNLGPSNCRSVLLHSDGQMRLSIRERNRRAARLLEDPAYEPSSDSDDDAFRETIAIVRLRQGHEAFTELPEDELSETPPTSPRLPADTTTPFNDFTDEMAALNIGSPIQVFATEESIAAHKAAEGYESETEYQYNPNFDPPSPGEPSSPVFRGIHRDDDEFWPRPPHEVHTLLDADGNESPGSWVEIRADEFEWIENGHNLSQMEVDDFVLMHQMQLDDATRFMGKSPPDTATANADAGPSSEHELNRQTQRHFRNMAKVRRDIEHQAALISHVNKTTDDLSDREAVAQAVYQAITLNVPIKLCGIKTVQKADIANIFSDFLVGRDLLRTHKVSVQLEPDVLTVRDPAGTTPKNMRKIVTGPAKYNKFRAAAISIAKLKEHHSLNAMNHEAPKPPYMRPIGDDEEIFDPSPQEEDSAYRPIYIPISKDADEDWFDATQTDFDHFFEWCEIEFKDIFIGDGDKLPRPPLRVIQHEIPFIDESDPARPRRNYKIPEKYLPEWNDLYDKHVAAGIWIPMTTKNSDPMMPVIKKDSKFRPVTDLRARNANTIKVGVPPMEGNWIRTMLAKYKHQVVLDAKGMFQQMRVKPSDVWKTTAATPSGDVGSISAQQGDTNSGATQNRLLQHVYRRQQGRIMVNYADNIFVFANTWREMRANTIEVLVRSRVQQLYMNVNSFEVCPDWVNVLGMRIRHNEVRMDSDQRDAFLAMREPHDLHSLQQYVGTIQWLSQFVLHLAELLVPLTNLTGGASWRWTALQQLAYEAIRSEVEKDRVLTVIKDSDLAPATSSPIHLAAPPTTEVTNPVPGSYVFLVTDASATGVSATVSVGKNWWNAKPVSNHSRKLTSAQHNYATHEQELQAVFEGFQKFENTLAAIHEDIQQRRSTRLADSRLAPAASTADATNGDSAHVSDESDYEGMPDLLAPEPSISKRARKRKDRLASKRAHIAEQRASGYDPTTEPAFHAVIDKMVNVFDIIQNGPTHMPTPIVIAAPARKAGQRREPKPPQTAAQRAKVLALRKAENWDLPTSEELEVGPDFQPQLIAAIVDGYVTDPTWRPRLAIARDNIQRSRLSQALQANKRRKPSPVDSEENVQGTLYWLSSTHLNPLPERSRKWCPKFVGPFPLVSFDSATSTYTLDLPARYTKRQISPTFHASQVKRHVPNDDSLFPRRLTQHVPIFPLDVVALDKPMGITSIKLAFRKPDRFNPDVDHIWLNVGFNHGGEGTLRHDDSIIAALPVMMDANGTNMGTLFTQFLQSKDVDNVTDLARIVAKSGLKRTRKLDDVQLHAKKIQKLNQDREVSSKEADIASYKASTRVAKPHNPADQHGFAGQNSAYGTSNYGTSAYGNP